MMVIIITIVIQYHRHITNNNSIKLNSILYYLCAESTAVRPITDTAQSTYK
jgi:hypothetical protein